MAVNISAQFGKNEEIHNGLNSISKLLVDEPHTIRTAIVSFRTKFSKANFENGGEEIPTVRILAIEPLDGELAVDVKRIQLEAFRARTGNPDAPDLLSQLDADQGDDED